MDSSILYAIGIILLFGLGFALRWGAMHYAKGEVATAMLGAEKKVSKWAKEQAASGSAKREEAIQILANKVYPYLPPVVSLFVSREMLVGAIDQIYDKVLDYLDDGSVNGSIK